MTPSERLELKECYPRASEILYNDSDPESMETLEGIEKTVRDKVLKHVSPEIAFFFVEKKTGTSKGRKRALLSCVGKIQITKKQAENLGIEPYVRHSPLLEKCCLLLSANESYQNAEKDMLLLTGLKVGHSTHHRLVQKIENILPDVKQGLSEIAVDGGTIRLRGKAGEKSYWKEYKTARLQGLYYGAFFQDNLSLVNWINSQKLTNPFYCLGDGHSGIWNIVEDIGDKEQRIEIIDWYHLMENLYKIEAKKYQIEQVKALLWMGQIKEAIDYLHSNDLKGSNQFCN